MSEAVSQPEHTQEQPREKTRQDVIEHINEVISERIDSFNEQQEYDKKHEEAMHALEIEEVKNRKKEAYVKENTFTPDKPSKQASILKKMVVWGSLVLGLSAVAKEATAHSTVGGGKGESKKETIHTPEKYLQLTNENKQDWNDYIDWLETKGLKGSHKLDHKDFSDKMMNEFNEEFASQGKCISRDMVKSIQYDLKNYQMRLNDLEHKVIQKGGSTLLDNAQASDKDFHFMADLDNTDIDGEAGAHTTRFKFPVTIETVTHKKYFKSIAPHTEDQNIVFESHESKPEVTEFATPTASQFEK